jgi:hypothetical protein
MTSRDVVTGRHQRAAAEDEKQQPTDGISNSIVAGGRRTEGRARTAASWEMGGTWT